MLILDSVPESGFNPAELFRIAAQISTPLGLAGVIAVVCASPRAGDI